MSVDYSRIFREFKDKTFSRMDILDDYLRDFERLNWDTSLDVPLDAPFEEFELRMKRRDVAEVFKQYKRVTSEVDRRLIRVFIEAMQMSLDSNRYLVPKDFPVSEGTRYWHDVVSTGNSFIKIALFTLDSIESILELHTERIRNPDPNVIFRARVAEIAFNAETTLGPGAISLEMRRSIQEHAEWQAQQELEALIHKEKRKPSPELISNIYLANYYCHHASSKDRVILMEGVRAGVPEDELLTEFLMRDYKSRNKEQQSILDRIRGSSQQQEQLPAETETPSQLPKQSLDDTLTRLARTIFDE
jgi:hypothetical protein